MERFSDRLPGDDDRRDGSVDGSVHVLNDVLEDGDDEGSNTGSENALNDRSTNWKLQANLLLEGEVRLPEKELPTKRRVVRPVNGIRSVNWRRSVRPTFRRSSFPTRPWSLHVTPFQEQSALEEVGPTRPGTGSGFPLIQHLLRRYDESTRPQVPSRVFLCCWVVGILCTGMYSRERGKGGNDGPLDQPGSLKNKRQRSDALNRWRSKKNRASPMCQGSGSSPSPVPPQIGAPLFRTTSSDDALAEVTCVGATAVPTTAGSSVPEVLRPDAGSRLNDGRHLLGSVPSEPSRLREQRCCQHCGAKKIAYETVKFCCSEGAIKLATHPIPDLLRDLLFGVDNKGGSLSVEPSKDEKIKSTAQSFRYGCWLWDMRKGTDPDLGATYTAIMKNILSIAKVQPDVRGWTALIQVVERGHILVSQKDPTVSYRRFLFVDAEGTKVSAVAYNNNIRPSSTLLLPFKRYYVSGATLKRVDEKYRVGDYEFSWTITNTTLIQPCEEQIAPKMYGHIELQQFRNLHRFADTDNLQNVLGVVAYAFEEKQIGFDSVNRDILIVNEEYINNKVEIGQLIFAGAYKDVSTLLLPPMPDRIITLQTLIDPECNIRTAWIQGTASLGAINQPLWFGACMNCRKKFELQVTSTIICSSCNKQSQISARARIPIKIEDGTGFIAAVVYGEDAELLTKFSGVQLQQADEKGEYILEKLDANMRGKHIVCFVRMFNVNGPSYSVVKLYKDKDQEDEPALIENEKETKQSLSGDKELLESQLFTPSAKACLEEVAAQILKTDVQGQPKASVRRVLNLEDESSDSMGSTSALGNDYVPGTSGEGSGTTDENLSDSPLKKARTHT
ncbi:replication protein A 70 kDa DNA-binding subunit [Striga asiatica]|uniref:Replication protein A 70 kDa DNA-binding subunit n=1 Tax=Striga asiatica TaxID=4170 RepID=A0A5A7PR24_STRAF|nr:replication protein A 70 kDa DNA-binding subunit [Striga asiatica]